jgi:hypothetical protein
LRRRFDATSVKGWAVRKAMCRLHGRRSHRRNRLSLAPGRLGGDCVQALCQLLHSGFDLLREGRNLRVDFPLCGTWPFHMQANTYDEKPRYILHGGLLFQPLDRNFITASGAATDLRIRRSFENFTERHLYLERPEIVVLSRVLADPVNKGCDGLHPGIVDSINGSKIRSLADVKDAFGAPASFDVITLTGLAVPIVLKREDVLKADPRILSRYGVPSPLNLKP